MAKKARLTAAYIQHSLSLYRQTRQRALELFQRIRAAGYDQVRLAGEGELLEICRLTCLEQKIKVLPEHVEQVPLVRQQGLKLELEWPQGLSQRNSTPTGHSTRSR